MPAITFRTLTLQLRQLEQDGIVSRTVFAEVPPHVEYALTDLGKSMRPIIQAMFVWGTEYQKNLLIPLKVFPILRKSEGINRIDSHTIAKGGSI